MVRGRSLSDERVIAFVNENMIAVDINCNLGFPTDTPALTGYQRFYDRYHTPGQGEGHAKFSRGFTASLITDPAGSTILNRTQSAIVTENWQQNSNYNPEGYLSFLKSGLAQFNH